MGKNALNNLFIFLIILLISCNPQKSILDNRCNDDTNDCSKEMPVKGELKISLTINDLNSHVFITLYKDKFDDKDTLYTFIATKQDTTIFIPFGIYSVTARYRTDANEIIALDETEVIRKEEYKCSGSCWSTESGSVDLTL